MDVPGMALPPTIWFSPKNVWYGGGRGSLLFGSNVYSVRFCMPAYLRYQGVGWNILRKITCILHLGTDENRLLRGW